MGDGARLPSALPANGDLGHPLIEAGALDLDADDLEERGERGAERLWVARADVLEVEGRVGCGAELIV